MLVSYITLAFRNAMRHKAFSAINVIGLSLGMAACFLILQYVTYELSFDRFHPESSTIYRITYNALREGGESFHTATTFLPVARLAQEEFPEIAAYSRLYYLDRHAVVTFEEKTFDQADVIYADANFFQFFSYDLIKGDPTNVLRRVNTAAISESAAMKYFDRSDPLGKVVKLSEEFNELEVMITGVFRDPPPNSHLKPHLVVSMISYETLPDVRQNEWNWPFIMNYIRLRPGSNATDLERKLSDFVYRHFPKDGRSTHTLALQPLESIHLYSNLEYEIEPNGNAQLVFLLMTVAFLVLVIAYANYINLSTARSLDRAREVGIRKTLGSNRLTLIGQFLTEALTVNFMALVGAILWVQLFSAFFLDYVEMDIDFSRLYAPMLWVGLVILVVSGALLSSLLPAFILSSFQPIAVLRGNLSHGMSGQILRKLLVVFQFTISVALMTAAFAIYNQVKYMRNQPLGINIHDLLVVKGPRVGVMTKTGPDDALIHLSTESGTATQASATSSVPGIWTSRVSNITRRGSEEGKDQSYNVMGADERFIGTYGLILLAGRNFQSRSDTIPFSVVIINERAVSSLGFKSPEEAIHARIEIRGRSLEIVGVIKDYHHYSLRAPIDPLLVYPLGSGSREYFSFRINRNEPLRTSMETIESHWKSVYPANPFEYFFLDAAFDSQYKSDIRFEKVFAAFSLLALFVASIGLCGLASFVTTKRMREIGIRKILGSSLSGLVILLISDFYWLVILAGLIAIPLANLGIREWQSQFAFRDVFAWWMYSLPIVLVLLVAILTISVQTVKAALTNPVDVLKCE